MTGRDLIIYILQNHLEDEPIFLDEGFMNLLSETEAAIKFNVGTETIKAWFERKELDGIEVGEELYILPDSVPPQLQKL